MQMHIEELSPVVRKVLITLPSSEVDALLDGAAQAYGQDLTLDGFRTGTAPQSLVEKRYAKEINALAVENMLDIVMASLVHEHKLYPVNKVAHEGTVLVRGQDASLALQMEIVPPVSLPDDLAELSVQVQAPAIEPQVFFATLLRLRRARAHVQDFTEARRPQDGDVVLLDVDAHYAGTMVKGLCAKGLRLRLGGEENHPVLCTIARGLHIGEQGTGSMPCPSNYPAPALQGKDIELTVHLRDAKVEILPELDDAFAQSVGKKDLRHLQEDIYKELLNQVVVHNQRQAEESLLTGLLDNQDIPVPPSLLTIHKKAFILEAQAYFASRGIKGAELEQKLADIAPDADMAAQNQSKAQAFLMALAYREKLVISKEDLQEEIAKMAGQSKMEASKLEADLYASNAIYELQDRLLADKALRHLYTKAQKIVVDKEGNVQPSPSASKQ